VNIVHRPIPDDHDQLVVLDSRRRLYAALGSKGDSWHVVQPARLDDARVGDGKVVAGELICCCPAGQYGRLCWAVRLALAFEKALPVEHIAWLEEPATTQEVLVP
jgi:hypothetical protein